MSQSLTYDIFAYESSGNSLYTDTKDQRKK